MKETQSINKQIFLQQAKKITELHNHINLMIQSTSDQFDLIENKEQQFRDQIKRLNDQINSLQVELNNLKDKPNIDSSLRQRSMTIPPSSNLRRTDISTTTQNNDSPRTTA